jgi:PAS domain S-box-containing protein
LWANPVGAALFGATNATSVVRKTFGPAEPHRRQVAQLANRLMASGAVRLERLRGFGAPPGILMTCACARLVFADGNHGILVAALQATSRTMPLVERLRRLVEGMETPAAAFTSDGMLAGASDAARSLIDFRDLAEAGLGDAQSEALSKGHVDLPFGGGHMVLRRVGSNRDVGLVALITPAVIETDEPEQEAMTEAAPGAGFTLVDEFAEPLHLKDVRGATPPAPAATTIVTTERRQPLRFAWQMDAAGRFSLGSDEFTRLIGVRTAAGLGRPWSEIAEDFGLDPEGRLLEAVATRNTWSGITLYWPVDDGGRLPVEFSGLPMFDADRNFAGYRGFGVCRDLDSLNHLAELRRVEPFGDLAAQPAQGADTVPTDSERDVAADMPAAADVTRASTEPATIAQTTSHETAPSTDLDEPAETPKNVVPFRPLIEPKAPLLTPVENHAFDELARQLNERLDPENGNDKASGKTEHAPTATEKADVVEAEPPPPAGEPRGAQNPAEAPEWLAQPEPPARGLSVRDRALLDLLPTGVLIYRLDRLLYANPAFLGRIGYENLHALEHDGGLDALYVEPGPTSSSSTSEAGMPVTITASPDASTPASATEGRLFTISWDGEAALALIFSPSPSAAATPAVQQMAAVAEPTPVASPPPPPVPAAGHADAEDLGTILDTTSEAIVMFDAAGNIHACNRSAEALFAYDGAEFVQRSLAELFTPESQAAVLDELERIKSAGASPPSEQGRSVVGRINKGGTMSLSMTMGRTRPDGPNFFAVLRGMSQAQNGGNSEVLSARRLADGAASAKADMLARISHEVRSPLNTIIGFADVMIAERFGTLGNDRYAEYMKDIRASSERVVAIIDDLTELSRIETGKLDLAFSNQNLNEMVESCVSAMQPQANRERIIIRTSLANALPPVVADGRALRQITLNLIGTSIHLANPAGQVIVSTALSDFGEVILRVRDTGHGLNDNEVAAALEPFRAPLADQASDNSPVSLSLTKALVEANRAQFHIKTGGRTGTLIEVVFPHAMARG